MYLAFGFILGLQALNVFLAIVMILQQNGDRTPIQKVIELLSVFVTEGVYDAPDFENAQLSFEEMSDARSISAAEINQKARAIIDLDNEDLLYILNDKDVGLQTKKISSNWYGVSSTRAQEAKWVQIGEQYLKFKVIPVRVRYSIMWYSVYKGLEIIDGYKGADDIVRCLAWLTLVPLFTELMIRYFPGPCVVVKTTDADDNEP